MRITLYHGSPNVVKTPEFGFGTSVNDYGRGFYCTQSPDLGKEWAVKQNTDGYLNRYVLHEDGLRILNLESPEFTMLHWVTILQKGRKAHSFRGGMDSPLNTK